MESEKLKSCPFCGAQVELKHSHVAGEGSYITHAPKVGGNNCGIEAFNDFNIQGDLATAWNTRAPAEQTGWQPIETAPASKGEYFFARIAWGPEGDISTGDGMRWNSRWFVSGLFYRGGPAGTCQYEYRQIEVTPLYWCHKPAPPGTTRAPADLRSALEAETIERAARAMCVHDGLDPDEHIIGGQASGFEDYGPLWQAEQRSEGQLGITDYAGLARAALAPTKGDVS